MYARENYKKVEEIIEGRRRAAIQRAEERNAEVAAISDEIRIIDKEMRSTGLLLFKTACNGGDIEPIRRRNLELGEKRRRALSSLGLPPDYTDVKYTCEECFDTGFSGERLCKCFREMLIKENIKSSGMGALIERQSFDNFDVSRYKDTPKIYATMNKNLSEAKEFVEQFGKQGSVNTLLFAGKTGTGKTHLSTAIAKALIERGVEVAYDSAQNIMSAFEYDRFKSGYGPYEPRADKFLECELLIIDDLGTEYINQFTVSCLYNLINTRQNKGLYTILSTNLSAQEITEKYDDRICSRIMGSDARVLIFVGKDNRL